MPHDEIGVESLPIALLLGAMLAASTVAIGAACLERAQRMSERQRVVDSFNIFVERAQILSSGGFGGTQLVELELGDGSIRVEGRLVQLLAGDAVVRSEIVPLEMLVDGNGLRSGSYIMEIGRTADGRFIINVEAV